MVKNPQKQPTETAVVKLTAVAKPAPAAPWPTQQKVKDLAETLDRKYPDYQLMLKLAERLETATEEWACKPLIKEAQKLIERFEMTGGALGIKNGRLEKLWDACCPEGWWPEDSDTPAYGQVAKMITVLMGSFPTAKIPEPEIFVPALLDDVMALTPSFVELESTCRHLRKTKKFMPSISEVIETLEEQQKLWDRRLTTAIWMEGFYNDLRAEIAKATAAEEAAAERKAAKSQPIVVGDRVHNFNAGAGTVIAIEPPTTFEFAYCRVRFDVIFKGKNEHGVGEKYLERLIAGDEGYEPPAVPMIEHSKDAPMAIDSLSAPLDQIPVGKKRDE